MLARRGKNIPKIIWKSFIAFIRNVSVSDGIRKREGDKEFGEVKIGDWLVDWVDLRRYLSRIAV